MPGRHVELPKTGYAIEIDGIIKSEFATKKGAEEGAVELMRRFPNVRIRIYDAAEQIRFDPPR
ncbi:hypothetical protein ACVIHD_001513 [Bradyrhizobium embrapense]